MWNYLRTKLRKTRKAFTLIEVIIAMSVGSVLVLTTYNSFLNIITTLNETSVLGTMDNHADSIRIKLRNELLTAENIETRLTRIKAKSVGTAATDEKYDSLYYRSSAGTGNVIKVTNTPIADRTDIVNSSLDIVFVGNQAKDRVLKNIFNSTASDGVYIENMFFDISKVDAKGGNLDMNSDESNLLSYQFTLVKFYPNGKDIKKTYHFKELIECSNQD